MILLQVGGGSTGIEHALDCGAGIGRITKRLLIPLFNKVDMVEITQKFLDESKKYLGDDFSRVRQQFCCGLQDFTPDKGKYDVIWIQWVSGHLTDDDFIMYLRRCQDGLSENGVIILKDNFNVEKCFDEDDSSFTRTKEETLKLIEKAGLETVSCQKQKGFPKSIFDVYMFAIK